MREKLVSVVITTYGNRQDYLLEAVKSVNSQSYKNIETIVVDDNGINSTEQMQNRKLFEDKEGIIYYPLTNNSGAQVARNTGILISNGDYIAFLDDDDIWEKEKIQKQVDYLEKNSLDLVFCNGYRFYNDNINDKVIYQENFQSGHIITFNSELEGDLIGSTSHPLMRKACLAKTGLFDVSLEARQDYDMWIRFCKYYKVGGINENLFFYRYHPGVRITKSIAKDIDSYRKLYKKYKKDYNSNSKAKSNILFVLGMSFLKNRDVLRAFYYSVYSFCVNPINIVSTVYSYYIKKKRF
jgi:glycosyltransferase involved in cell wall biosynthesis